MKTFTYNTYNKKTGNHSINKTVKAKSIELAKIKAQKDKDYDGGIKEVEDIDWDELGCE